MNDSSDPECFVTPPLNNERVTLTRLYRELYKLDQGLSERFTQILNAINSNREEAQQLRADFELHRGDGHPFTDRAGVVKEELRLDAKKVTVLGAFFTFLAAGAGVLGAIIGS